MNNTKVISFRAHKNLQSWLVSAGPGFPGHVPELLRLILTHAAYEQANVSGIGALFGQAGPHNRQLSIGETMVFAVRLPVDAVNLIKECAASKHMGLSQWCALTLFDWYVLFEKYQAAYRGGSNHNWLRQYADEYRIKANEAAAVYAGKQPKQAETGNQAHQVTVIT